MDAHLVSVEGAKVAGQLVPAPVSALVPADVSAPAPRRPFAAGSTPAAGSTQAQGGGKLGVAAIKATPR